MVVIKSRDQRFNDNDVKRVVSSAAAKLGGVKKMFILGLMYGAQENEHNVRIMLKYLNLSCLQVTYSCDMKMDYYLLGKGGGNHKFNCIFCEGTSPWLIFAALLTLGRLAECLAKFVETGEDMDKAKTDEIRSVVNSALLHYPPETLVIDIINIPSLHILLGVVAKLVEYMEKAIGAGGKDWICSYLSAIHVTLSNYQGRSSLDGNACRNVLKKTIMLEEKVSALPATVSASAVEKVKDTIKVLAAFDVVVHRCWGMTLKGDYKEAINVFCRMYRALPGITFPPKFHIVEKEVVIFLERKQAKGYTNHGLGFWAEQTYEAGHHDFKERWNKQSYGANHPLFGQHLLDVVCDYNAGHL